MGKFLLPFKEFYLDKLGCEKKMWFVKNHSIFFRKRNFNKLTLKSSKKHDENHQLLNTTLTSKCNYWSFKLYSGQSKLYIISLVLKYGF